MSKAQDYELLIWWIFTDFKNKNSGKWLYFYNHYEVHQCDDLLASVQSIEAINLLPLVYIMAYNNNSVIVLEPDVEILSVDINLSKRC